MSPSGIQGKRILVADDSRDLTAMLEAWVESRGATMAVAGDGESALRLLPPDGQRCDALITDMAMEPMSGEQLVTEVRRRTETQGMPVIVLTGTSAQDHKLDSIRDLPGVAILIKPVRLAQLEERLAQLIAAAPAPSGS